MWVWDDLKKNKSCENICVGLWWQSIFTPLTIHHYTVLQSQLWVLVANHSAINVLQPNFQVLQLKVEGICLLICEARIPNLHNRKSLVVHSLLVLHAVSSFLALRSSCIVAGWQHIAVKGSTTLECQRETQTKIEPETSADKQCSLLLDNMRCAGPDPIETCENSTISTRSNVWPRNGNTRCWPSTRQVPPRSEKLINEQVGS